MSGKGFNYVGLRVAMILLSAALLVILVVYLNLGDSSNTFNQTFWVAMAGLAPALGIAYTVAVGQAFGTYLNIWRSDRTPHGDLRLILAFAGGSIGIAFAWLQAIVVLLAFRSILDNHSVIMPQHLLYVEALSTFVIPIVTILAYAPWLPWRTATADSARG